MMTTLLHPVDSRTLGEPGTVMAGRTEGPWPVAWTPRRSPQIPADPRRSPQIPADHPQNPNPYPIVIYRNPADPQIQGILREIFVNRARARRGLPERGKYPAARSEGRPPKSPKKYSLPQLKVSYLSIRIKWCFGQREVLRWLPSGASSTTLILSVCYVSL